MTNRHCYLVEMVGGPRDGEVFWWEGGHIPLDICLPVKSLQPTTKERVDQMLNPPTKIAFRPRRHDYYTRRPTKILSDFPNDVDPWAPWPFDYAGRQ